MQFIYWLVFLGALMGACGTDDKPDAQLKWGHLTYAKNAHLINLRPNDTLGVCGPYKSVTEVAVMKWARAIGRGSIRVEPYCFGKHYIQTEAWSRADICRRFNRPANCNIAGFAGGQRIVIRRDLPVHNNNLILHEVGHLWGLCDQYGGGWHPSCDRRHRSTHRVPSSIMGMYRVGLNDLTMDDIRGIRALAARRDIPANAAWRSSLAHAQSSEPDKI